MKLNKYLILIVFVFAVISPQLICIYQNNLQKQKNIEIPPAATNESIQELRYPEKELVKIPAEPGKTLTIPILMYHEVGDGPDCMWVSEQDFYQQMKYLHDNNYQTVTLSQAIELLNGHYDTTKKVVLTFDDGYLTFYSYAWPILKEFNQQATIFIIGKMVEKSDYLTWEQIKLLAANGIEIGGHTKTHPLLPTLDAAASREELIGGKQDIETQLGQNITTFCYPTGRYNDKVIQQVKEAGYIAAVTMVQRKAASTDNLLLMPRLGVYKDDSLDRFISVIK
jgi:peptidoglycan/xylan/chitin deacetylase (PgdA/CDA1 family)